MNNFIFYIDYTDFQEKDNLSYKLSLTLLINQDVFVILLMSSKIH